MLGRIMKAFFKKVVLIIILFFVALAATNVTYAILNSNDINCEITIQSDGQIIYSGNLLGDDLWYPGKKEQGVIRINNHYKAFEISSFNIKADLEEVQVGLPTEFVYQSLLDNLELSIMKGSIPIFETKLMEYTKLSDLVSNNQKVMRNALVIDRNGTLDLNYSLKMSDSAGDELEEVWASVQFAFEMNERQ